MYPPKQGDFDQSVAGLIESLARAGLEAVALMKDPESGAWVIRLFSSPPKKGVEPMHKYCKSYMKACGHSVHVKTTKLRLWVRKKN